MDLSNGHQPSRHPATGHPGTGHPATGRRARRGAAVLAGALLAIGLAGCSGDAGTSSSSADAQRDGAAGSVAAGPAAAPTAAAGVVGASDAARSTTAVQRAAVIKTGTVKLTSKDIAAARASIDRLLAAAGGTLDDEHSTSGRTGSVRRSTLVLRVPVARFEAVKEAIERLGTLRSSTETAKDVTTQVIDTRERVQTLQNSLDRLQRFQRRATDVRDLIRFEDDITSRQSELQSLEAQQSYLAGQTSMSTITVELATPAAAAAPPRDALAGAGFLPGLRHGWHALVGFAVVALTAVGAVLPWLMVLVALGWPALLLLRRRARRTPSPPTPSPTS